jgi:hypothetical protein
LMTASGLAMDTGAIRAAAVVAAPPARPNLPRRSLLRFLSLRFLMQPLIEPSLSGSFAQLISRPFAHLLHHQDVAWHCLRWIVDNVLRHSHTSRRGRNRDGIERWLALDEWGLHR